MSQDQNGRAIARAWPKVVAVAMMATWLAGAAGGRAAPLKALIVDGQNNHDWKATTPLLKQQLVQTNLFEVAVATTPPQMNDFRPKFSD
jgi:hypothetical protein